MRVTSKGSINNPNIIDERLIVIAKRNVSRFINTVREGSYITSMVRLRLIINLFVEYHFISTYCYKNQLLWKLSRKKIFNTLKQHRMTTEQLLNTHRTKLNSRPTWDSNSGPLQTARLKCLSREQSRRRIKLVAKQ